MKLIQVGNTVLNLEAIAISAYMSAEPAGKPALLLLAMQGGHTEELEGEEAEAAWAFITAAMHCRRVPLSDLSPVEA